MMEYCTKGRMNRLDLFTAKWKDFKSIIWSQKGKKENTTCITEYFQKLKTGKINVRRKLHSYYTISEFKGVYRKS